MKNKKLTNKELGNYLVTVENKLGHAINTMGQTIFDYIEFNGDKDKFIEFLKTKYKTKESRPEEDRKDSKET
jgi:hypothetical protein